MKRINLILSALLLLTCAAFSSGCTVYGVAMEERNVGDIANDKKMSLLIEKQFLEDDLIKYMDFDAYTYEGRVYLVGEYDSREQTARAVQIAKAVEGVRSVTTYFLPKRAKDYCGTTDNLEMAATLRKDLIADKDIWSTNIDVETVQCNIVLLGIVGSTTERDKAIAHAKAIPMVRGVKSYIRVK